MIDLTDGDNTGYELIVDDSYEDAIMITAEESVQHRGAVLSTKHLLKLTREQAGKLIGALGNRRICQRCLGQWQKNC